MGKKTRGNGEGSIFQRMKNGKKVWVAQYLLYKQANGTNKYKTYYGKTRQEVKEKLEKLISELRTDKYVDKNVTIFLSVARSIIDDGYRLNKLTDSSYNRKLGTLKQIEGHYMSNMEIQKITEYDVKDFLSYITKYSNSVIGKIYGLVNNTFNRAVKKNIIKYNFLNDKEEFCKPKSKREDKKVRAFKIHEQQLFLDVIFNKEKKALYKYQMLLSMFTGMRMGEINALKLQDIDFKTNTIIITKTLTKNKDDKTIMGKKAKTYRGIREIDIDDYVKKLLQEYIRTYFVLNPENLLFYDKEKTYITTSQVNMVFKRLCQKHKIALGYDVNQHMLRHTYATRCIESGMPPNVVQKFMGHTDLRTTLEIYCDVFAEYEKKHSVKSYDYLKENGLIIENIIGQ